MRREDMAASGRRITVVISLALLAFSLLGCHKDTEKEKIEKVVETVQKAAENKEVKQVLSNLSKAYGDPQGNDYEGIKQLLLFYFFRHQKVSVLLTNLEIDVASPSATARFQAILSGRTGSSGAVLPDALGAYRFAISLKKESGEWKVTSAGWERFGDDLPGYQRP